MSYFKAKDCFNDSLNYIDAPKNPVSHNLSVGLNQLTEAIESDMHQIKQQLVNIANVLQQLAR